MKGSVWRNIGAAVLGYIVMFATLFVAFSLVWLVLGPEGSFRQGTWGVTSTWVLAAIVLGLLAAIVGGWVCALAGATSRAVHILIGIIIVMSILSALPEAPAEAGPRPEDVTMMEAMANGRQPGWMLVVNPLLGIVGVLIGGRLGKQRQQA